MSRRRERRLEADLAVERDRVSKLLTLLMSREAPQEFAAYVEAQLPRDEFPADALWDESGLYYVETGED